MATSECEPVPCSARPQREARTEIQQYRPPARSAIGTPTREGGPSGSPVMWRWPAIAWITRSNAGRSLKGPEAPNPAKSIFWSTVAGVTSFIANAGSPPIQGFLLPLRLDKTVFVATTTVYFAFMNAIKLGPYIWLGLFSPENLTTSAILLPLALAGIFLGIWLHARVPEKPFYFWCILFLFVTGLKLLWDGSRLVFFS